MHFDDRLATVLRHRAAGEAAARTQFRQLLDLLGAHREGRDESLRAAAWLRLGALGEMIPSRERAAMIAERGWRFRNPELAAHLAEDEPDVAAAALARADLDESDWAALIPTLPIRARGFLRLRKDLPPQAERVLDRLGVSDRGLPMPEIQSAPDIIELPHQDEVADAASDEDEDDAFELTVEDDSESDEPAPSALPNVGEIGALVARIEAFQRSRSAPAVDGDPRLPLGEEKRAAPRAPLLNFAFSTDGTGRVEWAEPRVAPMVVGLDLTGLDPAIDAAFGNRQPIRSSMVDLPGAEAVAGEWVLDAVPRFSRPSGRFTGYAGKLRRPAASALPETTSHHQREADRIRQLLHELRTPVNAIQGFAEVIQQQLFGMTPHEYRALAAAIAGDSARMLAGFDELDRLARLEAGQIALDTGECAMGEVVRRLLDQLQGVLKTRVAGFEARLSDLPCPVAIAEADSEQLVWRMMATLAGLVRGGERLGIELVCDRDEVVLACELPASLTGVGDIFSTEFHATGNAVSSGIFGAGFTLRLARAEARSAGGNLARIKDHLVLTLPIASGNPAAEAEEPSERRFAAGR